MHTSIQTSLYKTHRRIFQREIFSMLGSNVSSSISRKYQNVRLLHKQQQGSVEYLKQNSIFEVIFMRNGKEFDIRQELHISSSSSSSSYILFLRYIHKMERKAFYESCENKSKLWYYNDARIKIRYTVLKFSTTADGAVYRIEP